MDFLRALRVLRAKLTEIKPSLNFPDFFKAPLDSATLLRMLFAPRLEAVCRYRLEA